MRSNPQQSSVLLLSCQVLLPSVKSIDGHELRFKDKSRSSRNEATSAAVTCMRNTTIRLYCLLASKFSAAGLQLLLRR